LDKKKTTIIEKFKIKEGDTGSTEVQVALLTDRISQLTGHMAANKHDFHSQRGLLKLVGRRRRLLSYLNRENVERYRKLISSLGLRK
jgi:small subunit ribosomal protein S15